jgi:hypothetical protein
LSNEPSKTKEIIEIIRKNHNVGNNHIVIDKGALYAMGKALYLLEWMLPRKG